MLLAGDVELNPGPFNYYQLHHPNLCGYFRAAIFFILNRTKLIPIKDNDGNDILEYPTFEEGINDLKDIFAGHYNIQLLDLEKLMKIKNRFLDVNKKWGKNRNRQDKKTYYNYFSTVNWIKLDAIIKQKHTLHCEECNKSCQEIHTKFPSTAPKYEKDRNGNISATVNQIVKSHKESRGACKELTKNINNVLNDSFKNHFGISFQESYQKCYKFEKKMTPEEKRNLKCAIIREAVSEINEDNVSTAVDRLYGARQSLQGWDSDRKKSNLNLSQKQKNDPQQKNSMLMALLKKQKVMLEILIHILLINNL